MIGPRRESVALAARAPRVGPTSAAVLPEDPEPLGYRDVARTNAGSDETVRIAAPFLSEAEETWKRFLLTPSWVGLPGGAIGALDAPALTGVGGRVEDVRQSLTPARRTNAAARCRESCAANTRRTWAVETRRLSLPGWSANRATSTG